MRDNLCQFGNSTCVCISLGKVSSGSLHGMCYLQLPLIFAYRRPQSFELLLVVITRKPLSTPAWRPRNSAHCRVEQRCSLFGGPWKAWLSVKVVLSSSKRV